MTEYFPRELRTKLAESLRRSHNLIHDTSNVIQYNFEEAYRSRSQEKISDYEEVDYLIPLIVEYSLYAADDVGRDLGDVSRGILSGIVSASKKLEIKTAYVVEKTARAMLLESDWRDIDLRIVIENFIKKEMPDWKSVLKSIYLSEKNMAEKRDKAA